MEAGEWVFWHDPGGRVAHRVKQIGTSKVLMECGAVYNTDELRPATEADPRHSRCEEGHDG